MQSYEILSVNEAYRLINHGPVVLVSTRSSFGSYNIAPIAWSCPLEMKPTQILFVTDIDHMTYKNIMDTKEYAISIPHISQVQMVRDLGSVSGTEVNKFTKFNILSFNAEKVGVKIPENITGWLECRLIEAIERRYSAIVIGECLNAKVLKGIYNNRLLVEKREAKTLHHLGGRVFMKPANKVM
jgi:flavin reductase (DIM6/NTAB) family NADH-FMN oxidoreductase RutF